MRRRKRQASTFNLSFLDIMSCGFGAVVLVFLIIDRAMEDETRTINAEVFSEINLLEEDIREGQDGLVQLRNAVSSTDADIVEAKGLATRVTEELDRYESLIASLEEEGFTDSADIEKLKAELNRLEEQVKQLRESSEAQSGRSAREFTGDGNRQYLTGLNLGGDRIVILLDVSSSMLADKLINIIRLRNMGEQLQRDAEKWVRALDTVDWLTAQLPINAQYQIITFNTQAKPIIAESAGKWLDVADTSTLQKATQALRQLLPTGGTSLHNAFDALQSLPDRPDNIFLITDGLPTQGVEPPSGTTVTGRRRVELYRQAVQRLPKGVPVNIILAPMEGDPMAASEFWQLAQVSGGSFMSPARDWP